MSEEALVLNDTATEVIQGLKASPKSISSKYFYDDQGSRIFQRIMDMPEYYLTDCETEIFQTQKSRIAELFCEGHCNIDLVELGAGDGSKTRILIDEFLNRDMRFRYIPVDISEEAVKLLAVSMQKAFPDLQMEALTGDYFHMLGHLSERCQNRKVILFLGSNLGNFDHRASVSFLSRLHAHMSKDDLIFIGLDLKKDPALIRSAYDDPHGHTREFNLNLLRRFNRELGSNFRVEAFAHRVSYDPRNGLASSALESLKDQEVCFASMDECIRFDRGELIHTEISRKYDPEVIASLAQESGFKVKASLFDSRNFFVNTLWAKA